MPPAAQMFGSSVSRKQVAALVIGIFVVVGAVELAMGRVAMCKCGTVCPAC